MATLTLRPTSGTGDSWSNVANIYDGNQSTSGSVSVSRLNYTYRTLVLDFDTSVIPSGATINSATLTIRSQAGKTSISAYVDINQLCPIKIPPYIYSSDHLPSAFCPYIVIV